MTLVMAGLRNSGRSLIWTMGEYGWNNDHRAGSLRESLDALAKPFSNGRRQQNPEQAHSFPLRSMTEVRNSTRRFTMSWD